MTTARRLGRRGLSRAGPPNAARLVVALDDGLVDLGGGQQLARATPLDQQLQLGLLVETLNLAWWIPAVVPEPVLVAVGIEDHRALAEARFQTIGVKLGLLLAHPGVPLGALGLHQPQRLAIVAPDRKS